MVRPTIVANFLPARSYIRVMVTSVPKFAPDRSNHCSANFRFGTLEGYDSSVVLVQKFSWWPAARMKRNF